MFRTQASLLILHNELGSSFNPTRVFFVPPSPGLLCDLLWSDPDKDITGWSENDRGVSFTFGPDVVSRFLQKHDMDLICRAHQVSYLVVKFTLPRDGQDGSGPLFILPLDFLNRVNVMVTNLFLFHLSSRIAFLWLGRGGWVRVLCKEASSHIILGAKLLWRV